MQDEECGSIDCIGGNADNEILKDQCNYDSTTNVNMIAFVTAETSRVKWQERSYSGGDMSGKEQSDDDGCNVFEIVN